MITDLFLKNIEIKIRDTDGYLYATQICQINNKKISDWRRFAATKNLINHFEKKFDNSIDLITIKTMSKSGSWIHPILLVHLTNWCMPEESENVLTWLKNNQSNKIIDDINDVTKTIEIENENIKKEQSQMLEDKKDSNLIKNTYENKDVINENSLALINKIFTFTNKSIKIYGSSENPYFCGKDICNILMYTNSAEAIREHVDKENKKPLREILDIFKQSNYLSLKGNEGATIYLSESGLYELIFSSKMEAAKKFKKWVFEEVLPSIRKIGQEKYLNQLKEKETIIQSNLEELQKKEDENKWLHIAAKYNAKYNIRNVKSEVLYVGAHATESMNYIYKIGKSVSSGQRSQHHSASTPDFNKFENNHTYTTYVDLALNIEKFIHAILDPLSANMTSTRTEHFIVHPIFLNNIINKILNNVDEYVDDVNEYVQLLKDNKYNYDIVQEILQSPVEEMKSIKSCDCIKCPPIIEAKSEVADVKEPEEINSISTEKICFTCHIPKNINCYEIFSRKKRSATCVTCRNKIMILCNKCKVSKLGFNFKMKKDGTRQQGCAECVPSLIVLKKCQKCKILKTSDNYDLNDKGLKYTYCIPCRIYKRKCLKCKEEKTNYSLTPLSEEKKYCNDCYTGIKEKNKYKLCNRCKKSVLRTSFREIDGMDRNRICDSCRGFT
jgi:prophage antirepressor-like protein